jgi:hypothetical protein
MTATIRKNSQGYNYRYADLEQTHRYLEETGQGYYQEVEVVDGIDYVVTICTDTNGRKFADAEAAVSLPLLERATQHRKPGVH